MMLYSGQQVLKCQLTPELERHLQAEVLKPVQRQQTFVTLGSLGGKNAEQVGVYFLLGE